MIPGGNINYTAAAYQQMLNLASYQQAASLSANAAVRSPFQAAGFPGTQPICKAFQDLIEVPIIWSPVSSH